MTSGLQTDILPDKLQKKKESFNDFIRAGVSTSGCAQARHNQCHNLPRTYPGYQIRHSSVAAGIWWLPTYAKAWRFSMILAVGEGAWGGNYAKSCRYLRCLRQ